MKRKTLLSYLFLFFLTANAVVMAQDDEYFRKDTTRKQEEEMVIPPVVRKKEAPVVKKEEFDFKKQAFKDRMRVGGSFGLSFGTITSINLAPLFGYEITKDFVVAAGPIGMYFDNKFSGVRSAFYYGERNLLMYSVLPALSIIGELEFLNVEADTFTKYDARKWIVSPMLGLSLSQPTGGRYAKAVHLALLYNFNYNNQVDDYGTSISPYGRIFGQPLVLRVTFL